MRFTRIELVTPEPIKECDAPRYLVLTRREELLAAYQVSDYEPPVDFERCFLVAAHRGFCPSGGYGVRIRGLEQRGDQVVVRLAHRNPRPGEFVTMVVTYPRDVVGVERSELNPRGVLHFHFVDEQSAILGRVTASVT